MVKGFEVYSLDNPEGWVSRYFSESEAINHVEFVNDKKPLVAYREVEIAELWYKPTVRVKEDWLDRATGRYSYRGAKGRWNTTSTCRTLTVTRKLANLRLEDGKPTGEIVAFKHTLTIQYPGYGGWKVLDSKPLK